jgi:hypothetical protein
MLYVMSPEQEVKFIQMQEQIKSMFLLFKGDEDAGFVGFLKRINKLEQQALEQKDFQEKILRIGKQMKIILICTCIAFVLAAIFWGLLTWKDAVAGYKLIK